jgi:hypothetical protein
MLTRLRHVLARYHAWRYARHIRREDRRYWEWRTAIANGIERKCPNLSAEYWATDLSSEARLGASVTRDRSP